MATTAIVTALQYMIKTDLGKRVYEMLPSPEVEEFFTGLLRSSAGVERAQFSGVSAGWLVRKTVISGISGQFRWDSPTGDGMYTSSSRYMSGATQVPTNRYPGAANIPMPLPVQITIPMARGRGNIAWPSELLRVDSMTDAIADYTDLVMTGMARNIAINQANSFFAPSNGAIALVNGTPTSTGASDGIVIVAVDTGRIFQFEDGMLLDFYSDDGDTWTQKNLNAGSAVRCVVDGVNWIEGTLRCVCDTTIDAVADNDCIILADTYVASTDYARSGPLGVNDMLKKASTGTQYVMSPNNSASYGFNLDKYPKYGSYLVTVSSTLAEEDLEKYLGVFFESTGLTIDTIVTTRGVINKFAQNASLDAGRYLYERTGKGLQYTAGRGKVGVTYEGRNWTMVQSRFCPPGTLYGVKKSGNYAIAEPPGIPGTNEKSTDLGPPIEFIGQSLGYTSDFIPVLANSTHTEMVQAPFQMYYQVVCTMPQGMKLSSITED